MAVQEYLVIQKQANRRDTWMAQIIQAQAESKNMKQLRLWKQLQQTEAAQQKVTAVCKEALGMNQHHAGLQQVMAPKADGDPTRISRIMKEDLEVACLNEAHQQFTQVATTPMLQEPLQLLLGNTTLKSTVFQQVLDGMFQWPKACNKYTKKY